MTMNSERYRSQLLFPRTWFDVALVQHVRWLHWACPILWPWAAVDTERYSTRTIDIASEDTRPVTSLTTLSKRSFAEYPRPKLGNTLKVSIYVDTIDCVLWTNELDSFEWNFTRPISFSLEISDLWTIEDAEGMLLGDLLIKWSIDILRHLHRFRSWEKQSDGGRADSSLAVGSNDGRW